MWQGYYFLIILRWRIDFPFLLNYIKLKNSDLFIPACKEAERLVHMMNQVAAFLYYFLRDASLPKKFLMELLRETCDATLVAEIHDCDWNTETQTITTPHEKKED